MTMPVYTYFKKKIMRKTSGIGKVLIGKNNEGLEEREPI